MAHAYTPGLQVKEQILYQTRRVLPIAGDVTVEVGDTVQAETVVARTEQPGDIFPINLSSVLATPPAEIPDCMTHRQGDDIRQGDLMARSNGIFGLFRKAYHCPADGHIESVSDITGQVIVRGKPIPVEILAFVAGNVVETIPNEGVVIETTAAFIQGIFGVGGETSGPLRLVTSTAHQDLTPELLTDDLSGTVIVGGRRILGETVHRARELGVNAIIGGGIDDHDLKEILGHDLGVAVTGSEHLGITLVITEGFGEIAMARKTFELLSSVEGLAASVNGATQIRAGVQRPEIVIPLDRAHTGEETARRVGGGVLEIGSHVRLIRDPYFGRLGTVAELPPEPQTLESGSKARVLEVDCESGERVVVPRANVEIVGD